MPLWMVKREVLGGGVVEEVIIMGEILIVE